MRICVLGGGIVGTTTALHLTKQFPNAAITLLAEKFGDETLSAGAAGIFRPGTNFRGPSDNVTSQWITNSYRFYSDLLYSDQAEAAGVIAVSGYLMSSKFSSITRNHFLEQLLPVYREATPDELENVCGTGKWKYGAFFETLVVESGRFLPWAVKRFKASGGTVEQRRIESFDQLKQYDWIFNCSGLGAKWLCGDNRMVPLRGQVFKVKAPWVKMFYYGDYDTYIIPGSNEITLGGTRQFDSYNEDVDPNDSNGIWSRCCDLLPSLKSATVVREWVGLRPYRDQVRVEVEDKIIHCYGHGGYGITSAPGTVFHAVELLKEKIRSSKL